MAYLEDDPAGVRSVADLPNLPPAPDSPVIDGVEDDGVWRCYREQTLAALGPVGFAEAELAEIIALLSWRLRRVGRLEAEALADGFARQNEAAGSPARGRIGGCERVLAVICRYEGRIERARDRAVKELRALQQARRAADPATPKPVAAPQPKTTPSAGALGSIGKNAESLAGDRRSATPDPSERLASIGQNAGAAASGGSAKGPEPGATRGSETTRNPGAAEPGAVGSIGKKAGAAGAGASAHVPASAPTPRSGWVAPLVDDEEGAEEDEWTYSSYKSYWAEQDAAARAAGAAKDAPSTAGKRGTSRAT